MDGLLTVFGLGVAFGVFCSWLYDVIRKRTASVGKPIAVGVGTSAAVEPVLHADASAPVATNKALEAPPTVAQAVQQPAQVESSNASPAPVLKTETAQEATDLELDVEHADFADTVSFDETDIEPTPVASKAPRVVLMVNNILVRDVQENDLPALMQEFGMHEGSGQAQEFQTGMPVMVAGTKLQLAQA